MQGVVTIELAFWVVMSDGSLSEAASLMVKDTQFGFIAPIVDMSLTLQVTRLNVGSVDVLYSNIGKLSGVSIKLEINNGFRIFQPALNAFLRTAVI